MKKLTYIFTLLILCSCQNSSKKAELSEKPDKNYWRHLNYLMKLKNDVGAMNWEDFSKTDAFQPIIYYTQDGTFAVNPNEHIRNIDKHEEKAPVMGLKVIKLSEKYTDTLNFNFHTSYSDSDSMALSYKRNVLFFESFDLTNKLIGIEDLQDWSIMVIHELFHGYQRSIPEFKSYYSQLKIPGGPDQFLGRYYKELPWFKESVHLENETLKSIWIDGADLKSSLKKYDSLRSIRIKRIEDTFGVDIREVEDYEIFMEGHARYFESLCKRYLSERISDTSMLNEKDQTLITNMFEGYDIKKDKSLYDLYNSRYYYQLGYNISMILEKYYPEYKESIYIREHNFNDYITKLIQSKNAVTKTNGDY